VNVTKGIRYISFDYNLILHFSQPNKKKRVKRSSENKKLVFLSKKVLEEVSSKKETTGTNVIF
jgi:uncharacterized Rossmann fold enzyme